MLLDKWSGKWQAISVIELWTTTTTATEKKVIHSLQLLRILHNDSKFDLIKVTPIYPSAIFSHFFSFE